ncbi:MAG: hypothetical protein ACO3HF_06640 [Burkholderiaceae bacterium]
MRSRPFSLIVFSTRREPHHLLQTMDISVNYTSPWDKRYWAKDYADEALRILVGSGRWPAGSLVVEHTDPASPTHWRVVSTTGIQQPGW